MNFSHGLFIVIWNLSLQCVFRLLLRSYRSTGQFWILGPAMYSGQWLLAWWDARITYKCHTMMYSLIVTLTNRWKGFLVTNLLDLLKLRCVLVFDGLILHTLVLITPSGETKRKFESVYTGGTMNTPNSGEVFQYWHCCGSEDPFDPGCTSAPHASYDD